MTKKLGVYYSKMDFWDNNLSLFKELHKKDPPINQKWSWGRILRSLI